MPMHLGGYEKGTETGQKGIPVPTTYMRHSCKNIQVTLLANGCGIVLYSTKMLNLEWKQNDQWVYFVVKHQNTQA